MGANQTRKWLAGLQEISKYRAIKGMTYMLLCAGWLSLLFGCCNTQKRKNANVSKSISFNYSAKLASGAVIICSGPSDPTREQFDAYLTWRGYYPDSSRNNSFITDGEEVEYIFNGISMGTGKVGAQRVFKEMEKLPESSALLVFPSYFFVPSGANSWPQEPFKRYTARIKETGKMKEIFGDREFCESVFGIIVNQRKLKVIYSAWDEKGNLCKFYSDRSRKAKQDDTKPTLPNSPIPGSKSIPGRTTELTQDPSTKRNDELDEEKPPQPPPAPK